MTSLKLKNFSSAYNSGTLQGQAYKTLQHFLSKALHEYNLSIPEWKVLGQLNDHDELRVADLAALLSYDPPLVTKLIDRLYKKQLIVRKAHKSDRRVTWIVIAKKAKDLMPKMENDVKKTISLLVSGISREEMNIYIKVLQHIVTRGKENF